MANGNVFVIQKIVNLILKTENNSVHFDWIGGGEYFNICYDLIKQLNLTEYVSFHGAMEHNNALEIMWNGNIFIQNSITANDGNCEGTPVALLEAGVMGLAVVATKHEGILDIIEHGVDGYLVEPGDIDNLANYVYDFCMNEDKRILFGTKLKKKIYSNYTSDIYYDKFFNLIDASINNFKNDKLID